MSSCDDIPDSDSSLSDNGQDEDPESAFFTRNTRPPYLLLYREEEIKQRQRLYFARIDARSSSSSYGDPKLYPFLRFFDSIKGFYTGDLDLTGRHNSRFLKLFNKWQAYVAEFHALEPFAYQRREAAWNVAQYKMGKEIVYYIPENNVLWQQFKARWKVPDKVEYDDVRTRIRSLEKDLRKLPPAPKIQEKTILDLPPELLDKVFEHADLSDARILSATCRVLNDIGKRYIFRSRRLSFELPWQIVKDQSIMPAPAFLAHLREVAASTKRGVMDYASFLLSRPDLLSVTNTLSISGQMGDPELMQVPFPEREEGEEEEGDEDFDEDEPTLLQCTNVLLGKDFAPPILEAYLAVLMGCSNLTELRLHLMQVPDSMLHAICALKTLHTLHFRLCELTAETIQRLVSGQWGISSSTPTSPSPVRSGVWNLELNMNPEYNTHAYSFWHILLLFPCLRTLSVVHFSSDAMPHPPLEVLDYEHPHVLHSLERLSVGRISRVGVPWLAAWFHLAARGGQRLPLTHLKIETDRGIGRTSLRDLLSALQHTNIEVLVLDGVEDGDPEILDDILVALPNLVGLTLFRRENSRQRKAKAATWPRLSWEYAPHLAGFTRLQHFGWNIRLSTLDMSPSSLLLFEDGFLSEDTRPWSDVWKKWNDEEVYFDDMHLVAAPFGVHCPTLQTFAVEDGLFARVCCISREGGKMSLEVPETFSRSLVRRWNPTAPILSWPLIFPSERDVEGIRGEETD